MQFCLLQVLCVWPHAIKKHALRVSDISFVRHKINRGEPQKDPSISPSIPQDQIWRHAGSTKPASKCGEVIGGCAPPVFVSSHCRKAHSFLPKHCITQPWPPRRRSTLPRPRRSRCVSVYINFMFGPWYWRLSVAWRRLRGISERRAGLAQRDLCNLKMRFVMMLKDKTIRLETLLVLELESFRHASLGKRPLEPPLVQQRPVDAVNRSEQLPLLRITGRNI